METSITLLDLAKGSQLTTLQALWCLTIDACIFAAMATQSQEDIEQLEVRGNDKIKLIDLQWLVSDICWPQRLRKAKEIGRQKGKGY